ncbi:MAG: hypothetical protein AB7G11_01395 [Phycisphaerales bacterium]
MRRVLLLLLVPVALAGSLIGCGPGSAGAPAALSRATEGLRQSLSPAAPFQLASDTGKTLLYVAPDPTGTNPSPSLKLVLTRSSKVFDDRAAVREIAPRVFIQDLPEVKNAANFQTSPVTGDGLPGFETTAIAFHSQTNARLHVVCVKLYAADGTHTILGLAPVEAQAQQTLRDAAATFRAR